MARLLFISTKNRWFFRLALIAGLCALALIILDTYSHLSGITAACPDWPLCYGHFLIPNTPAEIAAAAHKFPQVIFNYENVRIVMILRYLIMVMSAAVICMTYMAFAVQRQLGLRPLLICMPLLGCVLLQIFLNKLATSETLPPTMALANLLVEFSSISLFWWAGCITRPYSYSIEHISLQQLRPWAWLALAFIAMQITFGGWINVGEANSMCASFPYCNAQLTPPVNWQIIFNSLLKTDFHILAHLHMLHRIIALVGFLYLGLFSFLLLFNRYIYDLGFVIFILVCGQFSLGVINISWLEASTVVISQNVIVALMLLATISLLTNLYNKPQDYIYA